MDKQSPAPNPYDVLEVSSGASNEEITKAFALAMKHRKYPPDAIALARKSLMNPQERIIADYLRPIVGTVKRFKRSDFSVLDEPAPTLEFLPEFDDLEKAIADSNQVSETDKRLGATLFAFSPIQSSPQKKVNLDDTATERATEYSHSFVKKKQTVEEDRPNSQIFSILPWLSALFICLLVLFLWGVVNEFKNTPSSQLTSVPTETQLPSESTSQSKKTDISVPEIARSFPEPDTQPIKPQITSTESNSRPQSFFSNFPLNSCGDKDPGGTNSWYPVYVEDTEENLSIIQNNYCQDAIRKYRKERKIQSIQVASFLNRRKAQEFAHLMEQEIGTGEVGEPSVYNFDIPTVSLPSKNSLIESQNKYNFPLNSCGDQDPGGTNIWYPVYVDDTEENLRIIRTNYCRDAIRNYRENRGIHSIQVASFLNQREAQELAEILRSQIGSGEVGESSIY